MKTRSELEDQREAIEKQLFESALQFYNYLTSPHKIAELDTDVSFDENKVIHKEIIQILGLLSLNTNNSEHLFDQIVHYTNYHANNSAIPEFKAFAKFIEKRKQILQLLDDENTFQEGVELFKKIELEKLEVQGIGITTDQSPAEEMANFHAFEIMTSNDRSSLVNRDLTNIRISTETEKVKKAFEDLHTQSFYDSLSDAKKAQLLKEDLTHLVHSATSAEITSELDIIAKKSAEFVKANKGMILGTTFIATAAAIGGALGGPITAIFAGSGAATFTAIMKGADLVMDAINKDKTNIDANTPKITLTDNDILKVSDVALHVLVITNDKVRAKLPTPEMAEAIDQQKNNIHSLENKLAKIKADVAKRKAIVSSTDATIPSLEKIRDFYELGCVSEVDFSNLSTLASLATEAETLNALIKTSQDILKTTQPSLKEFDLSNITTTPDLLEFNRDVQVELRAIEANLNSLEKLPQQLKKVTKEKNDDIQLRAQQLFASNKETLTSLIDKNLLSTVKAELAAVEESFNNIKPSATTSELLNLEKVEHLCRVAFTQGDENPSEQESIINRQTANYKKVYGELNIVLQQVNTVVEKTKDLPSEIQVLKDDIAAFENEAHSGLEILAEEVLNERINLKADSVPIVNVAAAKILNQEIDTNIKKLEETRIELINKLRTSDAKMKELDGKNSDKQIEMLYGLIQKRYPQLDVVISEFSEPAVFASAFDSMRFTNEAFADLAAANLLASNIDLSIESDERDALVENAALVIEETAARFKLLHDILKTVADYNQYLAKVADNESEEPESTNTANFIIPEQNVAFITKTEVTIAQKIKWNSHVATIIYNTRGSSADALKQVNQYMKRDDVTHIYNYNRNDNMGTSTRDTLLNFFTLGTYGIIRKFIHVFKKAEGAGNKRKIDCLTDIAEQSETKRMKLYASFQTMFKPKASDAAVSTSSHDRLLLTSPSNRR